MKPSKALANRVKLAPSVAKLTASGGDTSSGERCTGAASFTNRLIRSVCCVLCNTSKGSWRQRKFLLVVLCTARWYGAGCRIRLTLLSDRPKVAGFSLPPSTQTACESKDVPSLCALCTLFFHLYVINLHIFFMRILLIGTSFLNMSPACIIYLAPYACITVLYVYLTPVSNCYSSLSLIYLLHSVYITSPFVCHHTK